MVLPAARIVTPTGTQGSGVVLAGSGDDTYVLTNHHVVSDCIKQDDRWDPVGKSSSKVERLLPVNVELFRYDERGRHVQTVTTSAEIVAYAQYGDKWSFEGDLALLKLRVSVDGVPAACLIGEDAFAHEVRILDDIVMVGCPDGSEMPLPTTGHIASLTEERAGVGLLLSQVFGNPGSSGSAVYRFSPERKRYEVVAVHSMVDSRGSLTDAGRGSFLRLAVPAPRLHEFLQAHDFGNLAGPSDDEEEEEEQEPAAGTEEEPPAGNATSADDSSSADGNATSASKGDDPGPSGDDDEDPAGAGGAPAGDEPPPAKGQEPPAATAEEPPEEPAPSDAGQEEPPAAAQPPGANPGSPTSQSGSPEQ